jgi:type IV pilus assembly protein PilA
MKHKKFILSGGFTLIELLVVIGIIAILASVVLVAVNPARQFAQARNSQRISNTATILNAIGENMADNAGIFVCGTNNPLPASSTDMKTGGYDIRNCIVPNYVPEIPVDPTAGSFVSTTNYDTGYYVAQDPVTKRITVSAPATELIPTMISVTR